MDKVLADEEFISTVTQASAAAIRNHQKEKREALRNAVLNTALGKAPEDFKRAMFLTLVDQFTVWHLRILHAFAKNDQAGERRKRIQTSISQIADVATELLPELREHSGVSELVVDELCRKGLVYWNREGGETYLKADMTQVTALGQEFLRFIDSPVVK